MGYIVITEGRKNMTLFLVNRNIIKNKWWSTYWTDSFIFKKQSAAQIQANKLRFKSPRVITVEKAMLLSAENDRNWNYELEEHPFSSEALGQE